MPSADALLKKKTFFTEWVLFLTHWHYLNWLSQKIKIFLHHMLKMIMVLYIHCQEHTCQREQCAKWVMKSAYSLFGWDEQSAKSSFQVPLSSICQNSTCKPWYWFPSYITAFICEIVSDHPVAYIGHKNVWVSRKHLI